MSTLLFALGRWSYRHSWRVIIAWLIILLAGVGGALTLNQGVDNTFSIPGTEAQEGMEMLSRTFPEAGGTAAQYIVVAADGDSVAEEPYRSEIADLVAELGDVDSVRAVTDPFDEMVTGLVSDDDSAAIVRIQLDGQATSIGADVKSELKDLSAQTEEALPAGADVALGGDLFSQSIPALSITEAVGLLIALVVLVVTFRSFVVAGLPLLTALVGVGLSMALIFVATSFATVSSTTPLLALMLGLAVGIDYALFIVARHQDQVRSGMEPEESTARATGTAGSAVVFAGVTVLIALIGLGFAGIPFLTTMGIAASVAVAIAVAVAVTLTPAILGLLKGRVRGRVSRRERTAMAARDAAPAGEDIVTAASAPGARPAAPAAAPTASPKPKRGFAARWVGVTTRHPIVTTVAVVLGLGLAAIPATSLTLALPNAGMLPPENEARQNYDLTAEHFGPGFNGPLVMVGTIVTSTDPLGLMDDLAAEIETVPGVAEVALSTPNRTADTGIVQVVPETAPDDPATSQLVRDLRDKADELYDEYGVDLKVTGFTAVAIDISDRLANALLPFGLFVVGLSLILLTIVFRSIWVPIKATLGYLLSILAAFGAVGLVYGWGWFTGPLHATPGAVISFMPIILMGVLFGLAMDYEVFLVSRMREDYVHRRRDAAGAPARDIALGAIHSGFASSARVVTAAALIMFAVFAAFVPEGDASIKPIALGLAVGVAVDAFVVRMTLVPAVLALLRDKAWWIPKRLDRALPHFDIEGEAVERELSLAEWPEPATTAVVAAEGLSLEDDRALDGRALDGRALDGLMLDGRMPDAGGIRGGALFARVDLRLERGDTLVVTSSDPVSSRALLLTIAGRMAPTEGLLRVAGHLLPERSAWVRAHVGVALLDAAHDPAAEIRRALRRRTSLIVVDGADVLTPGPARERAAAALRDAAPVLSERMRDQAAVTVIVSAVDPAIAQALLAAAGRPTARVLDLARTGAATAAGAANEANAANAANAPALSEAPSRPASEPASEPSDMQGVDA